MASGDGLIFRVRPRLGRLTVAEVLGLCEVAARFGSGIVELTSRANLQVRGVRAGTEDAVVAALETLALLDPPEVESRRNIIVTPLWQPGDETEKIARDLMARLGDLPDLPAKFGFAVDAGFSPVLGAASADVRIERGAQGGLICRADGCARGRPVTADGAAAALVALARWFAATAGDAGRMARHPVLSAVEGSEAPAPPAPLPGPGASPLGPVCGVPFGQIEAGTLARLVEGSGAVALRLTPGRCLVLEGGRPVAMEGVHFAPDPVLAVQACPGAPFCGAASVATRGIARALAGHVPGLHVSGCAKGCAHPGAAAVTLVGRDGRFDLVRNGTAWDAPGQTGLTGAELARMFGAHDAPL